MKDGLYWFENAKILNLSTYNHLFQLEHQYQLRKFLNQQKNK
jgi:hypothetical protein